MGATGGGEDVVDEEEGGTSRALEELIHEARYDRIRGTYEMSCRTVELLRRVVAESRWSTARELMSAVRRCGRALQSGLPQHAAAGNMVRRVLKIVREEFGSLVRRRPEDAAEESLHRMVTGESAVEDYGAEVPELRDAVLDHIAEFQTELETCRDNIAQQAGQHIHSNEMIMTLGESDTVLSFLVEAARSRKFEVIVADRSPCESGGSRLAQRLAKHKIETTLIPDSAIFGIMSRVNKVIVGTETVMANGGLRAVSGSHVLSLAASHYSVPVIVLAPLYQLSPHYLCSYDQVSFNKFVSPEGVLRYSDGQVLSDVQIYNPVFDYVPPELVTLFISNIGGHSPSYIYRLLSELYHPDDYEL